MDELKLNRIKSFDELTITDDFMFGKVMGDPKNLKPLLEFILGVKIAQIDYPERQKTIDVNPDHKGIRLDVYCEDDKKRSTRSKYRRPTKEIFQNAFDTIGI